jgi:uncharacterized protein
MEDPLTLYEAAEVIQELQIDELPGGEISRYLLHIVTDGMGLPIYIPVLVAKGTKPGPVVGITAALHGNELNGIPVVQRLFKEIDPEKLSGTIVGVPVVNVPALLRKKRRFIDNTDLNHIFPGRADGNVSQVYSHRFVQRVVRHFNYLVDLHTASFGRANSYYIRADLNDPVTRQMAMLQNAQIVVHNPPSDGTLRGAADEIGIHAITLEVGDPNTFQKGMIRSGLTGIYNLLIDLGMIDGQMEIPGNKPIICTRSYWTYTDTGGILRVHPDLTEPVKQGQAIANIYNVFGDLVKTYRSPENGVVIGKNVSPINQTGGRIIHLGIIE